MAKFSRWRGAPPGQVAKKHVPLLTPFTFFNAIFLFCLMHFFNKPIQAWKTGNTLILDICKFPLNFVEKRFQIHFLIILWDQVVVSLI